MTTGNNKPYDETIHLNQLIVVTHKIERYTQDLKTWWGLRHTLESRGGARYIIRHCCMLIRNERYKHNNIRLIRSIKLYPFLGNI